MNISFDLFQIKFRLNLSDRSIVIEKLSQDNMIFISNQHFV